MSIYFSTLKVIQWMDSGDSVSGASFSEAKAFAKSNKFTGAVQPFLRSHCHLLCNLSLILVFQRIICTSMLRIEVEHAHVGASPYLRLQQSGFCKDTILKTNDVAESVPELPERQHHETYRLRYLHLRSGGK